MSETTLLAQRFYISTKIMDTEKYSTSPHGMMLAILDQISNAIVFSSIVSMQPYYSKNETVLIVVITYRAV